MQMTIVKGHAYGPYERPQALSSMGLVSNDLQVLWTGKTPAQPAPHGKD